MAIGHYAQDLIFRLRKRAEIRRQIPSRKSVQENAPDRLADLLEEAANELERIKEQMINTKLTPEERKQLQGMIKPKQTNKLIHPEEKIGEKYPKDYPIRGDQGKLF
jgi:hypothetical protein